MTETCGEEMSDEACQVISGCGKKRTREVVISVELAELVNDPGVSSS